MVALDQVSILRSGSVPTETSLDTDAERPLRDMPETGKMAPRYGSMRSKKEEPAHAESRANIERVVQLNPNGNTGDSAWVQNRGVIDGLKHRRLSANTANSKHKYALGNINDLTCDESERGEKILKHIMLLVDGSKLGCSMSGTDVSGLVHVRPRVTRGLPILMLSVSNMEKPGLHELATSSVETTQDILFGRNETSKFTKNIEAKDGSRCEQDLDANGLPELMQYDVGKNDLKHDASNTIVGAIEWADLRRKMDEPTFDAKSTVKELPI